MGSWKTFAVGRMADDRPTAILKLWYSTVASLLGSFSIMDTTHPDFKNYHFIITKGLSVRNFKVCMGTLPNNQQGKPNGTESLSLRDPLQCKSL